MDRVSKQAGSPPTRKVEFLDLPGELIFEIAGHISRDSDLGCLVRACRPMFGQLNPELYKRSCRTDNFVTLWAARTGSTATLETAVQMGADTNVEAGGFVQLLTDIPVRWRRRTLSLIQICYSIHGKTPLTLAAENGHTDTIRLLLQDTQRITSSLTGLQCAVLNGHAPAVELLLSHSASLPANWNPPDTPVLHLASSKGHEKVVSILMNRPEVDVNAQNFGGLTALHEAARNGHARTVKTLLGHSGINVNGKDRRGFTPLLLAIRHHRMSTVEVLLAHDGTDVNIGDAYGLEPLHWVARMKVGLPSWRKRQVGFK